MNIKEHNEPPSTHHNTYIIFGFHYTTTNQF